MIQVITEKGKAGNIPKPTRPKLHRPGAYDYKTGTIEKNPADPPTYTEVLAKRWWNWPRNPTW